MLLAVAVTLATPAAFVVTPANGLQHPKIALAPVDGAVKFTGELMTGFPAESRTVTCKALENGVLTVADCGVPPEAVILLTLMLVKEKEADNPPALAVTV